MKPHIAWQGSAEFVDHPSLGRLRFRLDRWRGEGRRALVCMCNASTADDEANDPTIHRLFELVPSHIEGERVAGFTVVNREPFVASRLAALKEWRARSIERHAAELETLRMRNRALIHRLSRDAIIRFVAWGELVPAAGHLTADVLAALSHGGRYDLFAFGLTNSGAPKHPMARGAHRIPIGAMPVLWRRANEMVAA